MNKKKIAIMILVIYLIGMLVGFIVGVSVVKIDRVTTSDDNETYLIGCEKKI